MSSQLPEVATLTAQSGASAALAARVPLLWLVRQFAPPRRREHAPPPQSTPPAYARPCSVAL